MCGSGIQPGFHDLPHPSPPHVPTFSGTVSWKRLMELLPKGRSGKQLLPITAASWTLRGLAALLFSWKGMREGRFES